MAEWVRAVACTGDRMVRDGFESHCGQLRFGTLAIPFTPLCQCLSDETLKAVGPFYLVSMPGTVLGRVHTCSGSPSGPVPLVRVAFTPVKFDRTRSGCGSVTCSHLFRNATGMRTVTPSPPPPPQHTRFFILGLFSSRRVTALTASRH